MSKDILKKCIEHMPEEATYQFAGFVEPFLNPECIDLIRQICEMKKTVNLYTTLVGVNEKILEQVIELPIEYVTLHVADQRNYAKIPKTNEYYRLLEKAVNSKKKDGRPFVDMCNAQAEPDEKVMDICGSKYNITSTLIDRAGNLKGQELVSKQINTEKITCGVCGKSLNKNELLPDGTLLLCCMDYGMQHVLGNLAEIPYDEIMQQNEMQSIKDAMDGKIKKDILCRKCSCANRVL